MSTSRKDFEAIARALRDDAMHLNGDGEPVGYDWMTSRAQGAFDQWSTTVLAIAKALEDGAGYDLNGNRRFDRERFLRAAGFELVR